MCKFLDLSGRIYRTDQIKEDAGAPSFMIMFVS